LETLQQLDVSLFFFINKHLANPLFDIVCVWLRNKFFWIPLYVFIAIFFFRSNGWKALLIIAFAGLSILIADQLSATVIKPFFERLRPCNQPDISAHARLLVRCGSGFSFVSSHAANHFALSVFLLPFFEHKWIKWLLVLWAFSVAFSQVYVGVHYPADVFCGGLLGALAGASSFALLNFSLGKNNLLKKDLSQQG
jgi:undecaprenyl-diphosphatase